MKKVLSAMFLVLLSLYNTNVFAENLIYDNPIVKSDYINDYTLIDCTNWNNEDWIAFDSNKSFATLKVWIENTINYINENINKVWNEQTASWLVLNIKVKCSFDDLLNKTINLWFDWVNYNNKLIIEWIDDNSLIFKETKFKVLEKTGNITFKNARFLNENIWYFEDQVFNTSTNIKYPSSNWITIEDSYIKLNKNINIWINSQYYVRTFWYWSARRSYTYLYNYTSKQKIINSKIDVDLDWDYIFKMPYFLKDSELNFINKTSTWIYDISFSEEWNPNNLPKIDYSILVSNKINLWWNNLKIENTDQISFLNNKISNIKNINMWDNTLYINNLIENNTKIDISKYKNLFNNIFKSWFTDSYDIENYRRNFALSNIWNWWIWWIYNRARDFIFWNIEINSADLYKEITGQNLANWLWDIYVIFNY